jgi:ribose transport system ATP-binding protein
MNKNANNNVLEMQNISKNFPGVNALKNVTISLKKGEVLGLIGENGAGKSTLIKILSGYYKLEHGEIYIDGIKSIFNNPHESIRAGIRVIYQELNTFEPLTVSENIFSDEIISNKLGIVNWKKMSSESKKILDSLGVEINPNALMENLTLASKQLIEIAKAIRKKAKILVMDEPTSALSEKEVQTLYRIIRTLKDLGVSIIYISHRIEEIIEITDRIIVLRDGSMVGNILKSEADQKKLINLIVGRDLREQYPKKVIKKGGKIFEVKNLSYLNRIHDISFNIYEGEILAFFGLLGSGVHSLFPVLFGSRKRTAGNFLINDRKVEIGNTILAKKYRMGFIPLDRKADGLALTLNVKKNIISANVKEIGKGFILDTKIESSHSQKWIDKLGIKLPGSDTLLNNLSGGNQQKVVVARWLECNSKIFLMHEPTRGIDVGSKAEIYRIVEDLCEAGAAVLIVSSELPEILAIADRVIVMRDSRISGEFETKNTTQEELMHCASV